LYRGGLMSSADRQTAQPNGHSKGRRLRLAFVGMRGLPSDLPKAGGGERETEAKATRLAQRGHDVVVYCRWHYNRHPPALYRGVRLVSLPSIPTKNLDTVTHTFLALLHLWRRNTADIVSFHGMGNALALPLASLAGKKTVVYMDGIDWERPKWGRLARLSLNLGARMAFRWADAVYVDNEASRRQMQGMFGQAPKVITLAAELWEQPGTDRLAGFGISPDRYVLFVGLLRPDKGVDTLVKAYEKLDTDLPLIIVGDDPDGGSYVVRLKATTDPRIHFVGYAYGDAARQLFAHCRIYVQPSRVEGNSPSLMSAMACGRCVVVSNIPANLETMGDAGLSFTCDDDASLRSVLASALSDPAQIIDLGARARERIGAHYTWDAVVTKLEELYLGLAAVSSQATPPEIGFRG
jgi:glycosyltransferase involved in cell wall biosynthesis